MFNIEIFLYIKRIIKIYIENFVYFNIYFYICSRKHINTSIKYRIMRKSRIISVANHKGGILVNMETKQVRYSYKGNRRYYNLTLDPSKQEQWDSLVNELQTSINSRTI